MKAVCWHGAMDVRVETVPNLTLLNPGDAMTMGIYGGFIGKMPFGAAVTKGLTFRMEPMHGQRYRPLLLDWVMGGGLDPSVVVSHHLPLTEAKQGYEMFKHKRDNCTKVVLKP